MASIVQKKISDKFDESSLSSVHKKTYLNCTEYPIEPIKHARHPITHFRPSSDGISDRRSFSSVALGRDCFSLPDLEAEFFITLLIPLLIFHYSSHSSVRMKRVLENADGRWQRGIDQPLSDGDIE